MIRVVGTYETDKVGALIDTEDSLEAIKMFIEKLQETERLLKLDSIIIDTEVDYI